MPEKNACVESKIKEISQEHPDWDHEHIVREAEAQCADNKEKDMSSIDTTSGGALMGGKDDDDESDQNR